jgi:RimJ/RimL family protein N-acetyltransferase
MSLPPVEPIETPRLLIREVAAEDLPDLLVVNGDPAVTHFLPYDTWQSPADGEAWLARMLAQTAEGTARQLVLLRRADQRVIGSTLLFRYESGSQRLELGYVLARDCWGQGYAREALGAVLDRVFGAWGMRRVEAEVNPDNLASNAVLRSLGFVLEGLRRERWVAKGRTYGVNAYGLLEREWSGAGVRLPSR